MFSRIRRMSEILTPIICQGNLLRITGGMVLTGASIGLNLVPPYVFAETVSMLASGESFVLMGMEFSPLTMAGIYGGTAWLLNNFVTTLRNYVISPIGPRTTNQLALRYIEEVMMRRSLHYNNETPLGDHVTRLTKCWSSMPQVSTELFTQILPTLIEIGFASGILGRWYGPQLGLGLGGILIIYAGYSVATTNRIIQIRKEMLETGFKSYDEFIRVLTHYETIHTFNNLLLELKELKKVVKENVDAEIKANSALLKIGTGQTLIAGLGFMSLCMLVANNVLTRRYTITDYLLIISYLHSFIAPLTMLGASANQILASFIELESVTSELQKKPEIMDRFPNTPLLVDHDNATIEFKNVYFRYPGTKEDVLKGVTFTINAGEQVAIVGESGAGKSTLAKLLLRFYEPTQGQILIGGQDIATVSVSSLRAIISTIPQFPVLFNRSLFENVAYGGLSRQQIITEEQVLKALNAASLTEFVTKLPNGLNTLMGEYSGNVSGGQKQRIATARALVTDPKIYLLDEATSALDPKSEAKVLSNMQRNFAGRTVVSITHKVKTLAKFDKILVLDGKIIEAGTHQELITKENGAYAKLCQEQSGLNAEIVEVEEKKADQPVKLSYLDANSSRFFRHHPVDVVVQLPPSVDPMELTSVTIHVPRGKP